MPVLYVTEQQSVIRKTGGRLVVEKQGEVLMEVPCLELDTVLIFGNVQMTSQALREMMDHGIEVAILSARGQLRGQLTPPRAKNLPLRMRQYEVSCSEPFCLIFAREIVAAKIASSSPGGARRGASDVAAALPAAGREACVDARLNS